MDAFSIARKGDDNLVIDHRFVDVYFWCTFHIRATVPHAALWRSVRALSRERQSLPQERSKRAERREEEPRAQIGAGFGLSTLLVLRPQNKVVCVFLRWAPHISLSGGVQHCLP